MRIISLTAYTVSSVVSRAVNLASPSSLVTFIHFWIKSSVEAGSTVVFSCCNEAAISVTALPTFSATVVADEATVTADVSSSAAVVSVSTGSVVFASAFSVSSSSEASVSAREFPLTSSAMSASSSECDRMSVHQVCTFSVWATMM